MRQLELRDGRTIPVVGQGTWEMGVRVERRAAEIAALELGLDLGMTLIDTAEMYAEGGAEEVVGRALAGRRERAFLVSKVLPQNASRQGTLRACERSLKRLRTDHLDLYLLHWESSHPLAETLAAFVELQSAGKIARFGVSNFDDALLASALALPDGKGVSANQVLYNLARRGIEWSLLPQCARRGILGMAYSPLDQARLEIGPGPDSPRRRALAAVAHRHRTTPAAIAIAWTIRAPGVVTIPKAATLDHVRANAAAAELVLTPQDLAELDAAFPPPTQASPLETT